jgi:Ras-related protein Rab-6A
MRSTYKIVFLGNPNVGKTTLMSQYLYREVENYYGPTIGLDFVSTTMSLSGHKVHLQLWDTAGQERFNSIIPNYTRNSFLTIVVFDMSKPDTFDRVDHWIENLVRINDPEHRIKIIIAGNKMDKVDAETRELYRVKGNAKAVEQEGMYVSTFARKHEGIQDLVLAISELIQKDLESSDREEEDESIRLSEKIGFGKNRGCC